LILGWLAGFLGTLWIIVLAWQRSVLWGLIFLLVPIVQLVYIVAYWKEAKEGFFLRIFGFTLVIIATLMGVPGR
jgi:hypothetical protein